MRSQSRERRFDTFLLFGRLDPDVDDDGRLGGNDVVQGSRGRDGRGDGRADLGATERRDVQHLVCRFDQGVDPGLGFESGVRRPARDRDPERAAALAAGLQTSAVSGALEDEYGAAGQGSFFDEGPRGTGADLLVGGHQDLDAGQVVERRQPMNGLHQTAQHVEHTRAGHLPVLDPERAAGKRA